MAKKEKRKPIIILDKGRRGVGKSYSCDSKHISTYEVVETPISKTLHHIHLGKQATGKTTRVKKFIAQYVKNQKKLKKPYKVLILDQFNEYMDIAKEVVFGGKHFHPKSGIFFINIKTEQGRSFASQIVDEYTNGLIVVENWGYDKGNPFSKFNTSISATNDFEHRNVSTYNIAQNARSIPSKIRSKATTLTLSNMNESQSRHFENKQDLISLAEQIHNNMHWYNIGLLSTKYKRRATINKYIDRMAKYLSIDIDLSKERIMNIPESVFCGAVNYEARKNLDMDTIQGLLDYCDKVKALSKYR